jgi:hypothetical protein
MCQLIDSELGTRVKTVGFSYSDLIKNLGNIFYSGGDYAEVIKIQLGEHLKPIKCLLLNGIILLRNQHRPM